MGYREEVTIVGVVRAKENLGAVSIAAGGSRLGKGSRTVCCEIRGGTCECKLQKNQIVVRRGFRINNR